jgi:hypothetical protein
VTIGFAMLSQATIVDDMIVVAHLRATPSGSRCCEIDLEPGAIAVEGPGCEHTARNNPGLDFTFAAASREQVEACARPTRNPRRFAASR